MRTKSKYSKADHNAFWNRNGSRNRKATSSKRFPVTEFLQENYRKVEEKVLGPGGGLGIGCGAGVGLGFVGGMGYGGWPWNHLRLVFGIGIGCGVGLGLGFGQGFGYGFSLDSLESNLSKNRSDSGRRFAIDL